jgi:hypothetical protein
MIPLDDPTPVTIKKGQKDTMCQKNETDTPYTPLTHYKGTWRKTQVETSQYAAEPQRRKGRHDYIEGNRKPTSR